MQRERDKRHSHILFSQTQTHAHTNLGVKNSTLTINDNFLAPHFNLFDSDARFFDISVISVEGVCVHVG